MTTAQKQAWFHLAVVSLAIVTMLALTPSLGIRRAQGGLGMLGFMGLSPLLFLRKKRGTAFWDERDALIQFRSWVAAYAVFWVAFVAACMACLCVYGPSGSVPVLLVVNSLWYAWIIVAGVSSIATLLQYGRGGSEDA